VHDVVGVAELVPDRIERLHRARRVLGARHQHDLARASGTPLVREERKLMRRCRLTQHGVVPRRTVIVAQLYPRDATVT
jgi:hypothetical protein